MGEPNGESPPEFVRNFVRGEMVQAVEGLGVLIGSLGASYRHLRKCGMRRGEAAMLLIEVLRLLSMAAVGATEMGAIDE